MNFCLWKVGALTLHIGVVVGEPGIYFHFCEAGFDFLFNLVVFRNQCKNVIMKSV